MIVITNFDITVGYWMIGDDPADNSGGFEYPNAVSKVVTDAFSCMKPNECFSKNDVGLLKKLIATLYKNAMKITKKALS